MGLCAGCTHKQHIPAEKLQLGLTPTTPTYSVQCLGFLQRAAAEGRRGRGGVRRRAGVGFDGF